MAEPEMTLIYPAPVSRLVPLLVALLGPVALTHTVSAAPKSSDEAPFLAASDAAMTRMMDCMAVKPTGDVDADFMTTMIPHHQGAIDMAQAELRWGRNEQLRRIAQEIIVEQGQEIAAMRLAVGQPVPPSRPAPTGGLSPADLLPCGRLHLHPLTMPKDHVQ